MFRDHLFRALIGFAVLGLGVGSAFAQARHIPTLSEWGLIALAGGLLGLGVRAIAKRNRVQRK